MFHKLEIQNFSNAYKQILAIKHINWRKFFRDKGSYTNLSNLHLYLVCKICLDCQKNDSKSVFSKADVKIELKFQYLVQTHSTFVDNGNNFTVNFRQCRQVSDTLIQYIRAA